MTRSLRIVIADDNATTLSAFAKIVRSLGHTVVASVDSGESLVAEARVQRPDLVISDIKMGGTLDGIGAAAELAQHEAVPFILISGYCDDELIERAQTDYVLSYLIKPVRKADLEAAITITMGRFEEFQILRMEADHYRQTLANRKVIERAKGILMRKAQLVENEAFTRLQSLAREKNRKLVEIAQMIVTADEVLS